MSKKNTIAPIVWATYTTDMFTHEHLAFATNHRGEKKELKAHAEPSALMQQLDAAMLIELMHEAIALGEQIYRHHASVAMANHYMALCDLQQQHRAMQANYAAGRCHLLEFATQAAVKWQAQRPTDHWNSGQALDAWKAINGILQSYCLHYRAIAASTGTIPPPAGYPEYDHNNDPYWIEFLGR